MSQLTTPPPFRTAPPTPAPSSPAPSSPAPSSLAPSSLAPSSPAPSVSAAAGAVAPPADAGAGSPARVRRISGFTPSGALQLGNYLGAILPTLRGQRDADTTVLVTDLHGLTSTHDPAELTARTTETATLLLAAGLDPRHCLFFVQSHVPEHVALHYLLECATSYGEAHRMIQFREKGAGQQSVRLSLLTYPVLMAADILLYDIDEVPVGEDQAQHVELARDVASRFNHRYGPTFVVPRVVNPPYASRVMDLSDPGAKMNKSNKTDAGVLRLLDPPEVMRRKVMRAVTDTRGEVRYDRDSQPGVANLLDILAACLDAAPPDAAPTGQAGADPAELAGRFSSYGELKAAVADAVVSTLGPIQSRYRELAAEPAVVQAILRDGARRASERAAPTVARARRALGLLST